MVGDLPNVETLPAGGRLPDAVVGDMDSVSARQLSEFSSLLVKVEEQDDNDQTKAFNHILRSYPDVDTIHIVAATGKRECHTIGNMGLLMEYARKHGACGIPSEGCICVDMVSDYSTIFAITDSCGFFVGEGRQVSLFSPDNSLTIKSEGLGEKHFLTELSGYTDLPGSMKLSYMTENGSLFEADLPPESATVTLLPGRILLTDPEE